MFLSWRCFIIDAVFDPFEKSGSKPFGPLDEAGEEISLRFGSLNDTRGQDLLRSGHPVHGCSDRLRHTPANVAQNVECER